MAGYYGWNGYKKHGSNIGLGVYVYVARIRFLFFLEVAQNLGLFKFSGRRQPETPVASHCVYF